MTSFAHRRRAAANESLPNCRRLRRLATTAGIVRNPPSNGLGFRCSRSPGRGGDEENPTAPALMRRRRDLFSFQGPVDRHFPRCPSRSFHALARGWVSFRRRRRSRHTPARGLTVVVVERPACPLSTSLHLIWTVCLFFQRVTSFPFPSPLESQRLGCWQATNGSDTRGIPWLSSAVPVDPPPHRRRVLGAMTHKTCWVKPAFSNFHPHME